MHKGPSQCNSTIREKRKMNSSVIERECNTAGSERKDIEVISSIFLLLKTLSLVVFLFNC